MSDEKLHDYLAHHTDQFDTVESRWAKYGGQDGKGGEEKGCLEMLALLPFMGVIYYVYQILSG